jgi:hypothetical protein
MVAALMLVIVDDGGCNNGFDANGTMPMASTTAVMEVRE